MRRWLPGTLFSQMLAILFAGLLVSQGVGTLIYSSDRAQAVRMVGGYALAQRIANLARLLDEAPADWRLAIATAASDPTLRVTLSAQPPRLAAGGTARDAAIHRWLAEQLPAALARRLLVAVAAAPSGAPAGVSADVSAGVSAGTFAMSHPMAMSRHMAMAAPWMMQGPDWGRLQAAVQLADGTWLSFAAALPDAAAETPWPFIAAMAVMAAIVLLASTWAVRRLTAPLRVLTQAAEQLGRDVNAPPLAEAGTREMRQAAQAFNQMQARIRRLLDNRTRMLAALSHDLRTPLTLLRLRAEALPPVEERERMLATLGEADAMVESSLAFARDQTAVEPARRTDVTALLASIADDMADAGLPVTMPPAAPLVLACQPGALRRALANLIDNAVKYGGNAAVAIAPGPSGGARITVEDSGPGIPPAELARVFEPFHRLEPSRSRETGGAGLGLAIALSIVQAHGGEIGLANRPAGGLRATVLLPA
jgi:signal transduction histidine kinase